MRTKGNLTKEKILAEATRLVQQKGFEATSICDLTEATGLKKGSLYFHFSGKDELARSILDKARADFIEFLELSLVGKTPGACLNNFFERVLEKHRSVEFVGGCIFGNSALEMSDKDSRLTAVIVKVFDEWIEKIQKVVQSAQSAGQVRKDLSAAIISRQIVMTLEGGIMMARLKKSEKSLKDCLMTLRTLIGLKV